MPKSVAVVIALLCQTSVTTRNTAQSIVAGPRSRNRRRWMNRLLNVIGGGLRAVGVECRAGCGSG